MDHESAVSEFVQFAINKSPSRITFADILQWAGAIDNWNFYNSVALEIAKSYHRGQLDYSFCDGIANDLWEGVKKGFGPGQNELPEPFYEIFLAFDAGEYHRKHDKSDDPVADHTDPWIAELAARFHF